MNRNYIHPNSTTALPDLLHGVYGGGEEVGSRAGRVMERTHVGITLTKPWQRELLVPNRKPNLAAQIAETMWVLAGRNDIEWLSHYLPRAKDFSDDGKTWRAGYGFRMRNWFDGCNLVDQLKFVVDTLRRDPLSRQAVISLWEPGIDTTPGKDIPCNDWLSFSSRLGKLDLHVAVRSNDIMWGWSGINAFEWSALQEVVAGLLGLEVGSLHFSITSLHLYERHWEKARKIIDTPFASERGLTDSPRFSMFGRRTLEDFDQLLEEWFSIEEGIRHGDSSSRFTEFFPEPMLRSWLRVLQWYWSGDPSHLDVLEGTRLWRATHYSTTPLRKVAETAIQQIDEAVLGSPFIQYVINLHNEKHAAYGDSWKRRGEMLGILANIARKIDRLGGGETADETSADTAIDLLVYLAKYRVWLDDQAKSDTPDAANELLRSLDGRLRGRSSDFNSAGIQERLTKTFDRLELQVKRGHDRTQCVDTMIGEAYFLARYLWRNPSEGIAYDRSDELEIHGAGDYRGADVD